MSDQLSLAALENFYSFEPEPISQFLIEHPFLVPLLEEAFPHLEQHFPDNHYSLNISLDGELEVLVHTSRAVDDVQERLDALDYGWWLANAARANGLMMIYHEFE